MAPLVDMHMHTNYSDGVKTPAELIEYAKQRHVDIMSINDHDSVKGVLNVRTMKIEGISIIFGIELSTKLNYKSLHIAGYFPRNTDFEDLQKFLDKEVATKRIERGKEIVRRMIEGGVDITWEEVEKHCGYSLPSRPRIAEVLVQKNIVSSVDEAFQTILSGRSPYFVPAGFMTTKQAVDLIHRYHGFASLAHPWRSGVDMSVLNEIVNIGMDGLECFPPTFHPEFNTQFYFQFAQKHHLLPTSGSDYHGNKDPEVESGDNPFPEECRQAVIDCFKKQGIL